ncbi:MAG: MBL fold metallo-hydrolase [Gaiellaceae bacterium]
MSLRVHQLALGPIETNAYVAFAQGRDDAVVIDPSADAAAIRAALDRDGRTCAAILITHGHWDHVCAVADLAEITDAPVHMPAGERDLLESLDDYLPPGVEARAWTPDVLLEGTETLQVAGVEFEVLSVPGHSPAHVAYATGGQVFSGDVLFAGSVGRTDLPGADWETLVASLRRLFDRLVPETVVHPGHGPATTLAAELATNPFLDQLRAERGG